VQCIYCEVESDFLSIIYINFGLQKLKNISRRFSCEESESVFLCTQANRVFTWSSEACISYQHTNSRSYLPPTLPWVKWRKIKDGG